ncbi:MAG: hypothetical protein HF982_00925 [Desulfobacteraceae bacterium]|nr:hypothetical protein [Desulfobacteraceae bacterium]MBC2718164.1 hypothetical protein [Desulfobacteraceae bacterium]
MVSGERALHVTPVREFRRLLGRLLTEYVLLLLKLAEISFFAAGSFARYLLMLFTFYDYDISRLKKKRHFSET